MIRFVDIRNQGTGYRFAFWNTVSDTFVEFDGEQAWNNWEDFSEVVRNTARFRSLCHKWVFNKEEDDIESFYN